MNRTEKQLVGNTKRTIEQRHKDYRRVMGYFKEAFKGDIEKKEPLRETDPDKMSALQLMSEGYSKLEEEQKEKEKEAVETIQVNDVEVQQDE